MADFQHIKVTELGCVVKVRIDRPTVKNAFDFQTIDELTTVARELRRRSDIAAVILTGGEQIFSAGQDLGGGAAADAPMPTLLERRTRAIAGPDLLAAWDGIEAITIAAIEGYCIGGACALALTCDFRIIAASGTLRLPEIPLGMNMPWGTVPRLAALIGPSRAKQFLLFGKPADAHRCMEWGLADEEASDGQALTVALQWAERVSALPPIPTRMTKDAVNVAVNANNHAVSFMDRDQYLLAASTDDLQEGIQAFRERRPPTFRGN